MFLLVKIPYLTILLFFLFLSLSTAYAETLVGRVVRIADGDTVTVLDSSNKQRKIRLMGIDAPEKSQAYGTRSKQHLSDLVFDKQVTIYYNKQDKYGRTVGKILVNGIDANLEQVKSGLAWHYKRYEIEQTPEDRVRYADAEVDARNAKHGLWADRNPIPPWEFRKMNKHRN